MDNRSEVREFLASRRAKITPERAGLVHFGGNRRVPGLRREEVAQLAGVSVDYYTRLERGNLHGASNSILAAISRALHLDDDERAHLFALARVERAQHGPARRRTPQPVRPGVRAILDGLVDVPASLTNGRMELVATNPAARALYAPLFDDPDHPPNQARFAFLDPRAREFWTDWETIGTEVVGALRAAAARDPYDKDLTDLIGELVTRSDRFRTWWGSHDVFSHRGGVKRIHHPVVGDLELTYEIMALPQDPDLSLLAYSAAPGSPSHDALRFLGSWAAASDEHTAASSPRHS